MFADEATGRLDPAAQAEPQTAECHSGGEEREREVGGRGKRVGVTWKRGQRTG